jgi:hypothetical protein
MIMLAKQTFGPALMSLERNWVLLVLPNLGQHGPAEP